MKPEEAIEIITKPVYIQGLRQGKTAYSEAMVEAVKALEKQIPKKVIFEKNGAKRCPSCGVKHFAPKWRPEVCNCTQKLEWGEDHE